MLGNEPLPAASSLRNWAAREGGQIARSLGQTLQLPDDVHYFDCGSDEAMAVRLQWYTIVVILGLYYYLFTYVSESSISV